MAFETFSLADVLNNAEIINNKRSRSNLDLLRGAALEENIESSKLSRRLTERGLKREEQTFNAQQQLSNTKFLIGATDQIIAAGDNGPALAQQFLPMAQERGIVAQGVDFSDGLDLEEVKLINQQAKLALGESPRSERLTTVGKDETIIDDQGNVIFSNFDPSERIDKETEKRLKTEAGLRKEFNTLIKDFNLVADSFGRVRASAKDPSAAGDLALIFNYMKMLDPGSTVREGEFATAQNAAGVPDRIVAFYNNIARGERMEEDQRNDFLDRSNRLFDAQRTSSGQTATAYEKIARDAGVRPENVVTVFREREDQPVVKITPSARAIEHLQQNPHLLPQFIDKYGEAAVPSDISR